MKALLSKRPAGPTASGWTSCPDPVAAGELLIACGRWA
jgi:hypothetical protein